MPEVNGRDPYLYSRPWHQRHELGPMLHEIGHEIYDQTEHVIAQNGLELARQKDISKPLYWSDITDIAEEVRDFTTATTLGYIRENVDTLKTVDSYITSMHDFRPEYGDRRLTFHETLPGVLMEGMSTGVIMPFQLFRAITWGESGHVSDPYYSVNQIQRVMTETGNEIGAGLESVIDKLKDPNFDDMLHDLAFANNGALGSAANTIVGTATPVPLCFSEPKESTFSYDADGRVIEFTERFVKKMKNNMKLLNSVLDWSKTSSGCPVRHETFEKIGPTAREFLVLNGNEDGKLKVSGESLISRGNRLVVAALSQLVEVEPLQAN